MPSTPSTTPAGIIPANQQYTLPMPRLERRPVDPELYARAKAAGATEVQAQILARRHVPAHVDLASILTPRLQQIPSPDLLADARKAASRLADAIQNQEVIGICVDYDVDGISGGALAYKMLRETFGVPDGRVRMHVTHRLEDGYGFTPGAAERVLAQDTLPQVLMTIDQGSSDEAGIRCYLEKARARGVNADVIVTDHHKIPPAADPATRPGPTSAYAFVNPQREDCRYIDKTICGATVAFLVLAVTRQELIQRGALSPDVSITDYLTYATAATIADCVTLASPVNRAIVQYGLAKINQGCWPAWVALREMGGNADKPIRSEDVAFGLGPRINSASRTGGDGMEAINFLLAKDVEHARKWLERITASNDQRREIERSLTEQALAIAAEQVKAGRVGLAVFLENGHVGIHGIVASRIQEAFGRPTVVLSPKDAQTISGSARTLTLGLEGVNIHHCLSRVQERTGIMTRFGGHEAAAGLSLPNAPEAIQIFQDAFDAAVEDALTAQPSLQVGSVLWSDGEIPKGTPINLDLVDQIVSLDPFGNRFDAPAFEIEGVVESISPIGKDKTHARVSVQTSDGTTLAGVWFRCRKSEGEPLPAGKGERARFLVNVDDNHFRGNRTVQVKIQHKL